MRAAVTVTIRFAAGHRITQHDGRCRYLHGHNYEVIATAEADDGNLDDIGRVIDFGELKRLVGGWIDLRWDHGFIYFAEGDDLLRDFFGANPTMKAYALGAEPTTENLGAALLDASRDFMTGSGCSLTQVIVRESTDAYAAVFP